MAGMSKRQIRRKFVHAMRRHETDIANAERAFDALLRDPATAESLGLPAVLPDFTVGVLRTTMALDRRGDERPMLAEFESRFA